MTIFTGIILYIMIYWLALFAVLPFGNKYVEGVDVGNVASAPDNANMKRKFIITAVLSAFIWMIVFLSVYFEIIDFYEIARQMVEEDKVK